MELASVCVCVSVCKCEYVCVCVCEWVVMCDINNIETKGKLGNISEVIHSKISIHKKGKENIQNLKTKSEII